MDTGNFTICVEGLPGLSMWTRDFGARLLAEETYQHHNRERMVTRAITLLENGVKVDWYDGAWMSGYILPSD
jgi:hypothetical protein